MSLEYSPYVLVQGAGALISLFAAVVAWRRRKAPSGKVVLLLMTSVALWSASVTLEQAASDVAGKLLFSQVSYIGAVHVFPLLLLLSYRYRVAAGRVRLRAVVILWFIPLAVLLAATTNGLHGLVWSSVQIVGVPRHAVYGHGPAWWALGIFDFALLIAATAFVGSSALSVPGAFARRGALILAAVIITWAGISISVAPFNPLAGLDTPALSLSIAGVLILRSLGGRSLELSPIARSILVEAMPDGLIVEDAGGHVADANPSALSLLNKDRSILGAPLHRALDDWPDLAAVVSHAGDGDMEVIRRDERFFELTVSTLRSPQGERVGRMVSLRDISERWQAEEATRESERNLRALLAAAQRQAQELALVDQVRTALTAALDLPLLFQTVVEGIAGVFGYTQVSLYIQEADDLVLQHQVGYPRVIERMPVSRGIMGRVFRSGRPELVKDVRTDPDFIGAIEGLVSEICVPLFDEGKPVGALNVESTGGVVMGENDLRVVAVLGEHMGIAFTRARLYAEARANEERYRALMTTLGEGVAIVDFSEHFEFANPAAEVVFGVPPEGLVGRSLAEFLSPSELARVTTETRKRRTGKSSTYEVQIQRVDGEMRQIELIATPRRGVSGEITGTLGIFRDVTELRRLQTRLEQERALLLSLIDNLPDYVYLKDRNSRFILTNKAQALLVGARDPRELVGKSDHDFMPKELADRYRDGDREVMRLRRAIVNIEEPSQDVGGGTRKILTTKVPIFDAEGEVTGIVGISRDITDRIRAEEERTRLQEQLQQAQKMEAVGRLAGGIAHDFNNILTVITGYCEMALEESRGNRDLEANVEEIKRAAMRASALISQLLAFSRRQILQPVTFDLGDLVKGMDGMLRRLLGEDIRLRTSRSGPGLFVHADPGRIEQVIMNLAVNARDAMPGGGLLTLHTSTGQPAPGDAAEHSPADRGELVLLTVSDTGQGMDAATLDRLFEPFFTTKDVGRGTGLGLATVYGIVRQSSGQITCRSELGKGTTFSVFLPRVSGETAIRRDDEAGQAKPVRGTERILLVEDDDSVRRYVCSILESAGYTVFSAEAGVAALDKLRSLPEPPDLLLTDVIMPGMDGRVLAQDVTLRFPAVRVLLMSGYAEVVAGVPGPGDPGFHLIQKPFSSIELLSKVREILEQPISQ
jgi:two-component system cell cycle sensor histidine kinase/response regulator CckA